MSDLCQVVRQLRGCPLLFLPHSENPKGARLFVNCLDVLRCSVVRGTSARKAEELRYVLSLDDLREFARSRRTSILFSSVPVASKYRREPS